MYGYIYKTTNLYNGKIYVGQHKAKKFDSNYYGSGVRFINIFNKHGADNFKCELLVECDSEEELNAQEIYWIAKLNATDRNIGYNLMEGGYKVRGMRHSEETKTKICNTLKEYYINHNNPRKGVHLSDETKEKLRQANLGKKYSEEVRAKHRRPAWNKGIPMSEEAKKHLSKINKGKSVKLTPEQKQAAIERFKGKNNPNYGGLKEETKEKLRQSILGRICINNGSINKQVRPEDFENIYKLEGFVKGRLYKH